MSRRSDPALAGRLHVVATPIGHWDDLSARALTVLESADWVAAEDTRYARRLLAHFKLERPLVSCHAHNQARRIPEILERLRRGDDVALITDAGTPGVSDPGGEVVAAVARAGFRVVPVPGACAATAAVSISGMAGRGFVFLGYLPRAQGKRATELKRYAAEPRPLVIYESPRRVHKLLQVLRETLGEREAMLGRELTKVHEEILRGSLGELTEALPAEPRGEFVVVVGASPPGEAAMPAPSADDRNAAVQRALASGESKTRAAKALARELGVARAEAYRLLLEAEQVSTREVRLVARGHHTLRATHHKSLELKRDTGLDLRETCVVGVGAAWDPEALRELPAEIGVTLEAGEHSARFTATRNPRFASRESMVFRTSRYNDRRTLGVEATLTARDLDRALVEALKDPQAELVVTIRGIPRE